MAFEKKLPTSTQHPQSKLQVLTGIFLGCLLVFILLAYLVVHLRHDGLDRQVMRHFSPFRYPAMVYVVRFITFFGSSYFLLPAYVLLIGYLSVKKLFREGLAIALVSFFGWVLLSQLKIFFHRHRPDLPLVTDITTYSFPSAHAFSSLIFFSLLTFALAKTKAPSPLNRYVLLLLLLCPVLVGLSRIILNVHYPTDVLAGYCLGTMWLIMSYLIYRKVTPVR